MIEPIVAASIWAVVASLVIAFVLAGLAFAIVRTARPVAATRHTLWIVALFIAGIAPVAIVAAMAVRGAFAPAMEPAPVSVRAAHAGPTVRRGVPAGPTNDTPRTGANGGNAVNATAAGAARFVPGLPRLRRAVAPILAGVWLLGALLGIAGLLRSIVRVRGLKARSSPLDGTLADELPWLTASGGREIYLRLSYEIETPIAIGFRRPVILIPTEMATADGLTSIEALVMHEYAHLVRYDDWTNFAQRAIERVFWFNPLVWEIGRRITLEREVAADEAVIERTHDAPDYAATLWRLAREMRMPEHVSVAPGAMLTRKQISIRIERLLEENTLHRPHLGAAALTLAVLGTCGIAAAAATAPPLVIAQAAPEAVPAAAPSPDATAAPARVLKRMVWAPDARGSAATPAPAMHAPAATAPRPASALALQQSPAHAAAAAVKPQRTIIVYEPAPSSAAHVAHPRRMTMTPPPLPNLDEMNRELNEHLSPAIALTVREQVAAAIGHADRAHRRPAALPSGPLTRDSIDGCTGCDLSDRDLHGLDLSDLSLMGVNLSGANLSGANLSGARLTGVNLERANLSGADLRGARLMGVSIDGANLSGTALEGAKLFGTSIGHVQLGNNGSLRSIIDGCNGCNLAGADLHDQDLHGIRLNGPNFAGANLSGANLRGIDLHGANLENADLTNADLTDSRLSGVTLRGAKMSGAKTTGMRLVGSSLP